MPKKTLKMTPKRPLPRCRFVEKLFGTEEKRSKFHRNNLFDAVGLSETVNSWKYWFRGEKTLNFAPKSSLGPKQQDSGLFSEKIV